MGVGALLNGRIVWLLLRGGEVQGLSTYRDRQLMD